MVVVMMVLLAIVITRVAMECHDRLAMHCLYSFRLGVRRARQCLVEECVVEELPSILRPPAKPWTSPLALDTETCNGFWASRL